MNDQEHHRILRTLEGLRDELADLVEKDPEQDVRGIAIPAIDAVIDEAKTFIDDDPVVDRVQDVMAAEVFEGYVRAQDVLIVVRILLDRVGPLLGSAYFPGRG